MMYPGLTHGAAGLVHTYGTEEQKKKYMHKLFCRPVDRHHVPD